MGNEYIERYEKARQMVSDLCEGRRKWTMSIPVRPDHDSDVVIADSLKDIPVLFERVVSLEATAAQLRDDLTFGTRLQNRLALDLIVADERIDELNIRIADYESRLRVALGGYPDSDLVSLAETLRKFYDAHHKDVIVIGNKESGTAMWLDGNGTLHLPPGTRMISSNFTFGEWIEWTGGPGGENPVSPGAVVEIRVRDGDTEVGRSGDFYWYWNEDECDIVAYRIADPVSGDEKNEALGLPLINPYLFSLNEWVPWGGGGCPVQPDAVVDIRFRTGVTRLGRALEWDWVHLGKGSDIVAYRIAESVNEE